MILVTERKMTIRKAVTAVEHHEQKPPETATFQAPGEDRAHSIALSPFDVLEVTIHTEKTAMLDSNRTLREVWPFE